MQIYLDTEITRRCSFTCNFQPGVLNSLLPVLNIKLKFQHKYASMYVFNLWLASLINNFGKLAIFVLSGHGIGADTCARILRNYIDDDYLLKTIYETEKQYVMTRGFWNT